MLKESSIINKKHPIKEPISEEYHKDKINKISLKKHYPLKHKNKLKIKNLIPELKSKSWKMLEYKH